MWYEWGQMIQGVIVTALIIGGIIAVGIGVAIGLNL